MSAAAGSLRLCLRTLRQAPALRATRKPPVACRRALSVTPSRWAGGDTAAKNPDEGEDGEDGEPVKRYYNPGQVLADFVNDENLTEAERADAAKMLETWNQAPQSERDSYTPLLKEGSSIFAPLRRPMKARPGSFWNDEEKDTELITDEVGEDDFEEDDILSMGHGKLEEHREAREYARIAVWEMPLLSKLAKPFEPPAQDQPLRFRYTSYMGEFHPGERKVVVEFCPKDLPLTAAQQTKLIKIAGARYNPEKEIVRMSCNMFEHQAQNKRYLGDLVGKLITEAKNPSDMFEDIPLDFRHHEVKVKPKFPKEWRMSEERRKQLEAMRHQAFLLDHSKKAEGSLVDGKERVAKALAPPPVAPRELVAERVGSGLSLGRIRGKQKTFRAL